MEVVPADLSIYKEKIEAFTGIPPSASDSTESDYLMIYNAATAQIKAIWAIDEDLELRSPATFENEELYGTTDPWKEKAIALVTHNVLTTYELLENILWRLPFKDLTRIQRVSKRWHNVTIRSKTLQKQLHHFSEPMFDSRTLTGREVHPLLAQPGCTPNNIDNRDLCRVVKGLIQPDWLLGLHAGTWEDMFICVPAVTTLNIRCFSFMSHVNVVKDKEGIRLRSLIAGIRQWLADDLGKSDLRRLRVHLGVNDQGDAAYAQLIDHPQTRLLRRSAVGTMRT